MMARDFMWLWAVSAACAANMLWQILTMRSFPSRGVYRSMLAGFVAGIATLVSTHGYLWNDLSIGSHLANISIYLCFSYVYFHFNNMAETARRVRLVIELSAAPTGLTRAELFVRYGAHEIIERRLERMLASNQLEERKSRFYIGNASVLTMARTIRILKKIVLGYGGKSS